MKKLITALCILCGWTAVFAADVVIDNIRYEVKKGNNAVSCRAEKSSELVNVEIPARVSIKGRFYPVTEIEEGGFKKCKNLQSIVIPNTVELIGKEAFWDCQKLESVVLPDKAEAIVSEGSYGFGRHGIFKGCKSLKRMRGTTMRYPQYMVLDAIFNCKEIPLFEELGAVDPAEIDKVGNLNAKFTSYTRENFFPSVEQWQRRKTYETVAQWESRVNDTNRKKMVDETVAESRAQFLKMFAPFSVKGSLEDYDADNSIFPIYLGDLGTVYASVPAEEADNFKANWKDVKVVPEYGIIDDGVGVVSCKFELEGKTYTSPRSYAEDDFDQMMLLLTPLASLREYEAQMAAREKKAEEKKIYAPDIVDIEIPATGETRNRTFAVIIGNENYQRVANVDYAQNDARVLAKYFTRTLGLPETNVRTYYDATYGDIVAAIEDVKNVTEAFKGDVDVIFYYAGHGVPDESNRSAYLLPVDANGTSTDVCYPVSKLYDELGKLNARHTVALLDACFSGSLRGDGMLASARGVKLKPKEVPASGNLIILSAASGDQTAYPYAEKNHGLFSYYLIKKLKDSEGNVTLGELSEYVRDNVSQQAVLVNQKPQQPTVKWSDGMNDVWQDLRFGGETASAASQAAPAEEPENEAAEAGEAGTSAEGV